MTGSWRVSRRHLGVYGVALLLVGGLLVHSALERVWQLDRVAAVGVLATLDAVAAAIEDDVRTGAWGAVQDRVRAMATQRLRVRYWVVRADGTVMADSEQIRPSGHLDSALLRQALAQGRLQDGPGAQPYEVLAVQPLRGPVDGGGAVLVVDASWERLGIAARRDRDRELGATVMVLMGLMIGVFVLRDRGTVKREAAEPTEPADWSGRIRALGFAPWAAGWRSPPDTFGTDHCLEPKGSEIAALKAMIVEADQARAAAQAADAAKSDFLARMSHDLRTPLHGIIGFAEMIRDQLVGPIGTEKYLDYARDIHVSGVHLLCLINDVLDLSKIEAGRFELACDTVWVGAVIDEAVHGVSPMAERGGLTLRTAIESALPPLTADEKTVRQMLLNLLSNAIKFTGPGGSVIVSARRSGGCLEITVADTGVGIEAGDMDRVFTEFGQGSNPRSRAAEGTGLGLVIVRSLIELHGGSIALQSVPGSGTAVTLIFPADRVGAGRVGAGRVGMRPGC